MKLKLELDVKEEYYLQGHAIFSQVQENCVLFLHQNMKYKVIVGELMNEKIDKLFSENQQLCFITVKPKNGIIEISYYGKLELPLTENQTLLDDYAELAIYSGAYPSLLNPQFIDISAKIKVPSNRYIIGMKRIDDYYSYQKNAIDIPIIISSLDILHVKSQNVHIYSYYQKDTEELLKMVRITQFIYDTLVKKIGVINQKNINIVLNPRESGGAYVRDNLLCFETSIEGMDEESFIHLAHEISHFWWHHGQLDIQNDWLNESFAQFTALKLAQDYFGKHVFQKYILEYQKNTESLPSLLSLDDDVDQETRYFVYYQKVVYLLYCFEQRIGHKKMLSFIKEVYKKKISTTNELLSMLTKEQKDIFITLLNQ